MLTKEQLLDEAQKQKAALAVIGKWRRTFFVLTGILLVLTVWNFQRRLFLPGAICAGVTTLSFAATLLTDLSIRNGRRNVERLLESLKNS